MLSSIKEFVKLFTFLFAFVDIRFPLLTEHIGIAFVLCPMLLSSRSSVRNRGQEAAIAVEGSPAMTELNTDLAPGSSNLDLLTFPT